MRTRSEQALYAQHAAECVCLLICTSQITPAGPVTLHVCVCVCMCVFVLFKKNLQLLH